MSLEELQAELQEAESAWLQKMAPIWREESEEAGNTTCGFWHENSCGKSVDWTLPR